MRNVALVALHISDLESTCGILGWTSAPQKFTRNLEKIPEETNDLTKTSRNSSSLKTQMQQNFGTDFSQTDSDTSQGNKGMA